MADVPGPRFRNRLLAILPAEEIALIEPHLEPASLDAGQMIEQPNVPIEHVYFPESGIASLITSDGGSRKMEAGPFGWEGMSGMPVLMHADRSPYGTLVQVAGTAHRIEAERLRGLVHDRPGLRRLLLRYAMAFMVQTTQTGLSAAFGVLEQRLARWLLMIHDRVDGNELVLTHDFIALMLAVRRPGVTLTIHELEGRALIRSTRGHLLVRDRRGLEQLSGRFYGIPEAEYARLVRWEPDDSRR